MDPHHPPTPPKSDRYHLPPLNGTPQRSPDAKLSSHSRDELIESYHHNSHTNRNHHGEAKYHGTLAPIEKSSPTKDDVLITPRSNVEQEQPVHTTREGRSKLSLVKHIKANRSNDSGDEKEDRKEDFDPKESEERQIYRRKGTGRRCLIVRLPIEVFKQIQDYLLDLDYLLLMSTTKALHEYRRETVRFHVSDIGFRVRYFSDITFQQEINRRVAAPRNQIILNCEEIYTFNEVTLTEEVYSIVMNSHRYKLKSLIPRATKRCKITPFGNDYPLDHLHPKLESLSISFGLANISAISALRHLNEVEILANHNLTDVSALATVRKVKLSLCAMIKDVAPLSHVHHLVLDLLDVSDISALRHNSIVEIYSCSRITDYSALRHAKKEVKIGFREKIQDLNALSTKLTALKLRGKSCLKNLTDLIPVRRLKSISFSAVEEMKDFDLSIFNHVPNMTIFRCPSANLKTIGGKKDLIDFSEETNSVGTDLTPFRDVTKVKLSYSSITNPLQLENVLFLELCACFINTLEGFKRLKSIKLRECSNITSLRGLFKVSEVVIQKDNYNLSTLEGLGMNDRIVLHSSYGEMANDVRRFPWLERYQRDESIPNTIVLLPK